MTPDEIIAEVEASYLAWDFKTYIDSIDIKKILKQRLKYEINKICIIPCSTYLHQILPVLNDKFNIVLCDNYKKGQILNDIEIIDQKELKIIDSEIDAYLVITLDPSLQKQMIEFLPGRKVITLNQLARDCLANIDFSQPMRDRVDDILARIHKSEKPLIILGGKFYNNFTPTFKQLELEGFDLFFISRSAMVSHGGSQQEYDDVSFKNKYRLNFLEMQLFLPELEKGVLAIISESFFASSFSARRALASLCYPLTIFKIARIPGVLFLYDMVPPFNEDLEYESSFLLIYKKLLKAAAGIIINSNTSEAEEFIKRAFNIDIPMLTFFRYNYYIQKIKPKKMNGFHIVMVGSFVNDVEDQMRATKDIVIQLLNMKINIHYYLKNFRTLDFYHALDNSQQEYFHLHEPIPDQEMLIREVSQYHLGWMVHNTQKIIEVMSKVQSSLLKDLFYLFHLTTVPSAVLLFGSSGLPMVINRSMQGLLKEFNPECFIPIEASEVAHLKIVFRNKNWDKVNTITANERASFSIEKHITKLVEFLSRFY